MAPQRDKLRLGPCSLGQAQMFVHNMDHPALKMFFPFQINSKIKKPVSVSLGELV